MAGTAMLRRDDIPAAGRSHAQRDAAVGVVYGLAAYVSWGVFPAYFKLLASISPLLVLAHRVLWSFAFLSLLSMAKVSWRDVRETLGNRRTLALLAGSTVALATNWGVFI